MLSCTRQIAALGTGGSYGNLDCFCRTDRASNLNGTWCAHDNAWYAGDIHFRITSADGELQPVRTTFLPYGQRTRYTGPGGPVDVTVLVPPREGNAVLWWVQRAGTGQAVDLRVEVDARLAPQTSVGHVHQPTTEDVNTPMHTRRVGCLTVSTPKPGTGHFHPGGRDPDAARAFGAAIPPSGWRAAGNGRALMTYTWAHDRPALPFALTFGPWGAERVADQHANWVTRIPEAIAASRRAWDATERTARVVTPSRTINRAVAWTKADSQRLQNRYPRGAGFTNNPPGDIIVTRDAFWMACGSTYLDPAWTTEMHRLLQICGIYPDGKVAEYVCGVDGRREDYGLDINDATPLFILSLVRHHQLHGGPAEAREFYPAVQAAATYILGRMQKDMVFCSAQDTNAFGIASWRNIIPGETITGAVTEINALCGAALRAAAEMAGIVGDAETQSRCTEGAAAIGRAMSETLWSDRDQWYHLTVAPDGSHRGQHSADAVFPALCEVGDPAHHQRVLTELLGPDFRTPRGIRTVACSDPEFDPVFGIGLVGGSWPNLTLWVARVAAESRPADAVALMEDIGALLETKRPVELNAVPGELPEWYGGDDLRNLGMALSPWAPPTYVWMAVEGLGGLKPATGAAIVEPHLPPGWNWLAVAGVPWRGERLTWFLHDGVLYCTHAVETSRRLVVLAEDVSDRVRAPGAEVVALRGADGAAVLVAAPQAVETQVVVPADLTGGQGAQRIRLKLAAGEARCLTWPAKP